MTGDFRLGNARFPGLRSRAWHPFGLLGCLACLLGLFSRPPLAFRRFPSFALRCFAGLAFGRLARRPFHRVAFRLFRGSLDRTSVGYANREFGGL